MCVGLNTQHGQAFWEFCVGDERKACTWDNLPLFTWRPRIVFISSEGLYSIHQGNAKISASFETTLHPSEVSLP